MSTLDDPRAHGFVIHGAAGVGKTRLADQCLALAIECGRSVARATSTEGSRFTPLGALAHLLPVTLGEERCDLVAVMSQVRPMLQEQFVNGPMVLFVDDLQHLDTASATLVGQLVDADLIFLVATVRADERLPSGLDALWHRGRVRRIDLVDLDRAAVDALLHLVLRDPVEGATVGRIWDASRGNALFVRELVLGAMDAGQLVHQHGVWRLVGGLVTNPRLQELVASRLATLEPDALDALERIAVWEPTGVSIVEDVVERGCLERLERAGLLTVRTDGLRQVLTLAHPLYGEILRARMPALARRRLLLEQADRIEQLGGRRRSDTIWSAVARLDATGSADPELLVRAARLARYGHDFVSVERLGRAAMRANISSEAGLLLGEALHELRRFSEADSVLSAAHATADERDPLFVYITEIFARNRMWGLGLVDEALTANRLARDRVDDAVGRDELTLSEAVLLTYAGRPADALTVLAEVSTLTNQRARALRAVAEVPALVAIGRCVTAAESAELAFIEHSGLPDQIAIPRPSTHVVIRIYALADSGMLDEAVALANFAYQATPTTAPPDALMWMSHQLGRCALLRGQLETARRWLSEALARCDASASEGPSRLVLSALATAHACRGDAEAARAAVAELDRRQPFPFTRPEQELGRAWALAASGDLPHARRVLITAAEDAATTGYFGAEAWLLHDVARLGDAAAVVTRLGQLQMMCEGVLVPAYACHAAALATGNPDQLVEAADRFERIGAKLLAAEAAIEAAQAYQRYGERRLSSTCGTRATSLAIACEGARSPALASLILVVPLTARERDIATLAAQGESSKAIAQRLFLSVRTVNNHLQSAYSKLGVAGRRELAAALGGAAVSSNEGDASHPSSSSPP